MTTLTHGTIGDMSKTGARFESAEAPGKGATALLKWGKHEAVCTIVWHDDQACGLWFKQALDAEIVDETAALDRVVELPIASVGNITQGRKRGAFLKRAIEDCEVAGEPLELPLPTEPGEAPCEPVSERGEGTPPAFGRAGGLAQPAIGHSETLAAVLRKYRATGSWRN